MNSTPLSPLKDGRPQVRLDPLLHRQVKIIIATEGGSIQDWINGAVEAALEKRRKKEGVAPLK